ncbi:MAG TPA: hypothetical protein PKK43_02125 [Spirochaetota bacterium]|nr:hypothetical protein [Spirochaetota bacterium]
MFGFILFTAILFIYGIFLSHELFAKMIPSAKGFNMFANALMSNGKSRFILMLAAFITGIWNLFAPDFGAMNSPTIIGDLVPSSVMMLNALIILPEIVGIFNIPKRAKNKFVTKMLGFRKIAGPVTLIVGLLHIIFFKQVLF